MAKPFVRLSFMLPSRVLTLRFLSCGLAVFALVLAPVVDALAATTRIKDIVSVEGVRDNMLVGYGLVVGLNGSGDTLTNIPFTEQSLVGMLERLGVNVRGAQLRTKDVAAVMVTATLPPFAGQGTRIDATIAALGDAKSLQGGTLLVTPLLGADSEVYAVAQGQVAIGGFTASGEASTVTKGVPTGGRIADGAIVEREVAFNLGEMQEVRLSLHNPDFTTARRIAQAINGSIGSPVARATDPANVKVSVAGTKRTDIVNLITDIEQLAIEPDEVAKVVIDEKSGVIVMGDKVRISTVAISQGNLTVKITETPQVSQPQPFSQGGTTTVVPRTQVTVDEDSGHKTAILPAGVSLQQLVTALNRLGVGPRDIISILQSIKAAGALQADLEVI
jgi:flagellar P-ring protein precursor FlgI